MIAVKGTKVLSVQVLKKAAQIRPEKAGKYWQGIDHYALLTAIYEEATVRSWVMTDTRMTLSKTGTEFAASWKIETRKFSSPDMSLSIGVVNSNSRRRALKLVGGAVVTVCNNGLAIGDMIRSSKHTTGFDLKTTVKDAFDAFDTESEKFPDLVQDLKKRNLNSLETSRILVEAGRRKLMPWSRLGEVDKEFQNSRFPEFRDDSCWALLNAFTWVVKKNPAVHQMTQSQRFLELLPTPGRELYFPD